MTGMGAVLPGAYRATHGKVNSPFSGVAWS